MTRSFASISGGSKDSAIVPRSVFPLALPWPLNSTSIVDPVSPAGQVYGGDVDIGVDAAEFFQLEAGRAADADRFRRQLDLDVAQMRLGDQGLEFHYRYHLGMVTFHDGAASASFEFYMRELGAWEDRRFHRRTPTSPLEDFEKLAADLRDHCGEFLTGSAAHLQIASEREQAAALLLALLGRRHNVHESCR